MSNGAPSSPWPRVQAAATIFATALGVIATLISAFSAREAARANHDLEAFKAQTEESSGFAKTISQLGVALGAKPMSGVVELTGTYVLARSLREKTILMDIVTFSGRRDLRSDLAALISDDPDFRANDQKTKQFLAQSKEVQIARADAQRQVNSSSGSRVGTSLSANQSTRFSDTAATKSTNAATQSAGSILSTLTTTETSGWMWVGNVTRATESTAGAPLLNAKLSPGIVPRIDDRPRVVGDSNIRSDFIAGQRLGRIIGVAPNNSVVVVLADPKPIEFNAEGQKLAAMWVKVRLLQKGQAMSLQ